MSSCIICLFIARKRFLPQPDCSVINKVHENSLLKNEPEFKNNRYYFVLLFLIVSCLLRTKILTLPITSFRWDLNFRRDRSKEQFHLREWVGVLVDWRNGRRSIDGWGKCRTDERTNPNRIVYFALRVLAANFKKTYFIFYGKHRSNNYKEL